MNIDVLRSDGRDLATPWLDQIEATPAALLVDSIGDLFGDGALHTFVCATNEACKQRFGASFSVER